MGMLDGIAESAKSISGSILGVDGAFRNILGSSYSQINAAMGQILSGDGIMRQTDMQNLLNMLQAAPLGSAGSAAVSTAKQAKILMMIVQINALKVQLQKLQEDLEEMQCDVADPDFGNAHRVQRDVNSIPSGTAEDAHSSQRLLQQQNDMFQMLSKLLTQSQDMSKSAINNIGR